MTDQNHTTPSGNDILAHHASITMSSREIADLTGSSHDNVLKTVRALVKRGIVFGNETPYVHPQNGQTYSEFNLDYRNTMVVASGYSPELRAKIIDRWLELEAAVAKPSVSVSELEATARQVMGGIVKSGLGKLHRELMTELKAELSPALEEMRALVVTHHVGAVAVDAKTAKEWLEEYGCVPEGRDGPVRKVGHALRDIALEKGIVIKRCLWRKTWLCPEVIARPYMDTTGRQIVREHNDRIAGQQSLPLAGAAKTRGNVATLVPEPLRRLIGPVFDESMRMDERALADAIFRLADALPSQCEKVGLDAAMEALRAGGLAIFQMLLDISHEIDVRNRAKALTKRLRTRRTQPETEPA